jgi:hypothetical protein
MPATDSPIRLAALLFFVPGLAHAGGYTALSYGSGPDGYRSYSFAGDVDLSRTVRFSLDHFLAQTTGASNTHQTGAGLSWQALELVTANYRYSETNDGTFAVKGNEGGLSFALDTLWQGELQTSLDLGYGSFKYKSANPQTVAASNFNLTQTKNSYGLSQDLTSSLTLYASHDRYKYDRSLNSAALLAFLARRPLLRLTVLSFPDKTNTLGMNWRSTDALSFDISAAKTTTLRNQEQKFTKLAVEYQANNALNLSIAATRSASSAIVNPNTGVTVQAETRYNYWEVTAGWSF